MLTSHYSEILVHTWLPFPFIVITPSSRPRKGRRHLQKSKPKAPPSMMPVPRPNPLYLFSFYQYDIGKLRAPTAIFSALATVILWCKQQRRETAHDEKQVYTSGARRLHRLQPQTTPSSAQSSLLHGIHGDEHKCVWQSGVLCMCTRYLCRTAQLPERSDNYTPTYWCVCTAPDSSGIIDR